MSVCARVKGIRGDDDVGHYLGGVMGLGVIKAMCGLENQPRFVAQTLAKMRGNFDVSAITWLPMLDMP